MEHIQDQERRSFERLNKFADGEFFIDESVNRGELEVIDYSRNGIRASIDYQVDLDAHLSCKLHFPERPVPLYPAGRVVWLRKNNQGSKFRYDVGIHLDDHDALAEEKTTDNGHDSKYLEKVADYAFHCGLRARHVENNKLELNAYLPAFFIAYFLIGALFAYNNPSISLFFSMSMLLIIVNALFKSRKGLLLGEKRINRKLSFLKQFAFNCAGILLIHVCYGVFFIAGYFSKSINTRKVLSVGR